ncbi:FIG003737: Predicted deacylase [Candidatus Phaeomarinobacter ectocarpi]|uniref:FIG003737: Predicted deacylase n=1 Tax=Candidatus Phaeomarinibacter ectocarpi TaxID=1458461 RepID=X5MB35_9HYPH|nr:succinylglutamate desuccinylase/aspartoacylase family protein [Candidatus Phaeomarinobacter ectocarpi]CDO61233.1 FIG003737: Predicted deacylase [Candidatus Phaeomarinobacter ectocarpi]
MPDKKKTSRAPLVIAGTTIKAGTREVVDLPLSMMSDHTPATLSIQAIHGKQDGPTVFVSAAIHGDEILGVEIVRRLIRAPALRRISGTVLLVPIVNMFGFISHSRYLPDRRDLNRSFPGSPTGSLAARLAHLFMEEVVERSEYGIDLHTAAINRVNLPQIRIDMRDKRAHKLADAFSPPVIVDSALREGSLRHAAGDKGVPVMVFEAGEGLRFDETAIRVGVKGVLNVLRHLGMTGRHHSVPPLEKPLPPSSIATKSAWIRATEGGIARIHCKVGQFVKSGSLIGVISDPFGIRDTEMFAQRDGLVIGRSNLPIVNQGDALVHIAAIPKAAAEGADLDTIEEAFDGDPLFDEDEIL